MGEVLTKVTFERRPGRDMTGMGEELSDRAPQVGANPTGSHKGREWIQVGGVGQTRESLHVGCWKHFGFDWKGSFFLVKPRSGNEDLAPWAQ